MASSVDTNKLFYGLRHIGYQNLILQKKELICWDVLFTHTAELVQTWIQNDKKDKLVNISYKLLKLWFPGMVAACDGKTIYNDIDLDVQILLMDCGFKYDE